ncbi:MAG: DEAD/DEAH box helicase family protein, partial [Lachnospiraceae bacterium]|nr:DEAD/DEAH box helicase family protein [Lachnospiraceae bacterium]
MRKIDLYDHNKEAYKKAETMMAKEGKAAIIHPTGTGKSFIAYALIERHPDKRFVWLAPTEYIYNLQMEKLWQKQHVRFHNVVFHTYNRLMWHEELIDELKPDYVILDEFHRVGAREWGKSTKKLLNRYPDAKVLGLSATNIRYLDNRRDMADELFEG